MLILESHGEISGLDCQSSIPSMTPAGTDQQQPQKVRQRRYLRTQRIGRPRESFSVRELYPSQNREEGLKRTKRFHAWSYEPGCDSCKFHAGIEQALG